MMRRCGLLGQTLKHSYSPTIHKMFGGDYSYELFEVAPADLADFISNGDWHGLNVTIPYKQTVMQYCHAFSPTATEIGSVNTIIRRSDGSLYGDNTDAAGFHTMLSMLPISSVPVKKALVLGSGGSSLTVCHVLKEAGAQEVIVISRSGSENYENLSRHSDAQLIVNTTPVGMYPHTDESPVSLDGFEVLIGVLDIVYNPARTRLLMDAARKGIPYVGGLPMLVGQASAAAKYFAEPNANIAPCDVVIKQLRNQVENIILIGMPGSGKTSVGNLLAKRLGRQFIDIDCEIEKIAGCTIPEIFERDGEESFRELETKTLKQWGRESGLIIATGGGVVTREENYPHLHQNGKQVLLERDIANLDRSGRPLSQGDLQLLYEQRLPLYRRFADFSVKNEGSLQDVVEQIVELIL